MTKNSSRSAKPIARRSPRFGSACPMGVAPFHPVPDAGGRGRRHFAETAPDDGRDRTGAAGRQEARGLGGPEHLPAVLLVTREYGRRLRRYSNTPPPAADLPDLRTPYQSQIVPLAAILADIGDDWEHVADRDKLVRWYWNGVFGELYGSAVETRVARDFMEVPTWLKG